MYVLARLLCEGWIADSDLSGLGEGKAKRIKALLSVACGDEVDS